MIGPSPSIAVIASTIVKCGFTVAFRSTIELSIPWRWRMFFGQPYTAPGTTPKKFFMLAVIPAQWCVFSFGNETITSDWSSSTGSATAPRPVKLLAKRTCRTSS